MIPCPFSDQELAEVAARHRVTVKDLRFRWEYPDYGTQAYASLDDAGAAAYRSRKVIESVAQDQAVRHMNRVNALAQEFGVTVNQIWKEKAEGDWPDERSAAQHLASRKQARPWWLRWLP